MTWFIIGSEDGIVGIDEFQNNDYMHELRIGANQSYHFEESRPSVGYNDGTYYLGSDGRIHWRSDEIITIPETPTLITEPALPDIDLKVLRIQPNFINVTTLPIQAMWEKLELVLKPFGWYVPLMVSEGNQVVIYLGRRGSISLAAAIALIIGVLVLFGLISFSWSVISKEKTEQEAEVTEQTIIKSLTELCRIGDKEACTKLKEIAGGVIETPTGNGEGEGLLGSIKDILPYFVIIALIGSLKK